MSQEKVNRYKQEKANRKEIMKKEKRMRIVRQTTAAVVFAALVAWVGFSGYQSYTASHTDENTVVDYTAVMDYINGLEKTE